MIAVLGEALIDAHVAGTALRTFPGGGPYNTAVALGRLGVPAVFAGTLSRDGLGRRLLEGLADAGVAHDGLLVDEVTPLAIVDPSADGDGRYRFYLRGTAFEQLPRPGPAVTDAEALVVGSLALALDPAGAEIERIALGRPAGQLLVVDPNVRAELVELDSYCDRLARLAHGGALFKLSRDDAALLFPGSDVENAADELLGRGARAVVVTDGAAGATVFAPTGSASAAAPPVAVVDTVGAGDAFTAGLLASLRRAGEPVAALGLDAWRSALAFAAATGAAQCTRASAWGPSRTDVERELVRGG